MASALHSSPPKGSMTAKADFVTPQRRYGGETEDSRVRVVVRIRPMSVHEVGEGATLAVYPGIAVQPPSSPCESTHSEATIESLSTLSKSSNTSDRSNRSLRAKVMSKIRPFRGKKNNQSKQEPPRHEQQEQTSKRSYPTLCCATSSNPSDFDVRQFEFDAVYGPTVSQQDLYDDAIGSSIIANIFAGQNSTILAYGMTGSGKTYTMSQNNGVISRAIDDIFLTRDGRADKEEISIQMSCLEIYGEGIHDLLHKTSQDIAVQSPLKGLKFRDNGGSVAVIGLNLESVASASEVHGFLDFAKTTRTTSRTRLNDASSRSHAVYTIVVTTSKSSAKLTLVDLAGSERIKDSGVVGSQRQESIHINKDLFVLGKVVSALHDGHGHVPYRDSKLTRFLRDSLGGNCRTILIACVSQANMCIDESINTLRYAERTRSVINSCTKQLSTSASSVKMDSRPESKALKDENTILRARVANLTRRLGKNETSELLREDRGMGLGGLAAKLKRVDDMRKMTQRTIINQASVRMEHCNKLLIENNSYYNGDSSDARKHGSGHITKDDTSLGVSCRIECCAERQSRALEELVVISRDFETKLKTTTSKQKKRVLELSKILKEEDATLKTCISLLTNEESWSENVENVENVNGQDDLALRCETLEQDIAFVNSENDILRGQNKRLQNEVRRLNTELQPQQSSFEEDQFDEETSNVSASEKETEFENIRSNAERLLDWADAAIGKIGKDSTCDNSCFSSVGTELRPSAESCCSIDDDCRVAQCRSILDGKDLNSTAASSGCPCQTSVLATKPEHVEFYLPRLRIMCSCGKSQDVPLQGSDPTLLVNILRGWQIEFLRSMRIESAADLVHSYTQRSKTLAKEMRRWRKSKGLLSVKTKSCGIALRIWTRSCKAVMKAVRDNKGSVGRPDFLDVSLSQDDMSMSTLGFT